MPRPSRNIDKLLIKTALEMLPDTGVSHLNIREVAHRAQVNLGMFHYHFKTKEAFVRIIQQELYESMFARLVLAVDDTAPALENLQRLLTSLGGFGRENHRILMSMIMDIKAREPLTMEFVAANFPRHLQLIRQQIEKAQTEGTVVPLPAPLIISFLAGSIASPMLIGGTALELDLPQAALIRPLVEQLILSDGALKQRIRMALKGISP